ncbi:MAG: phosphoserine phosphatase SerB [Pseudomonadota bacterium]
MTDKNTAAMDVAIAVAPADYGSGLLGEDLKKACGAAGLSPEPNVRVLGQNKRWAAVDLLVSGNLTRRQEARRMLREAMSAACDIALISAQNRRKRLLISDMDSTIIEQECLDELAAYAGLKDEIAAITARAMAGELDFEAALTERVGRLRGLAIDSLERCYNERISLMPGARTFVATMVNAGAHAVLVSGGFTFFTERVAKAAGFADHHGNRLMDDSTVLTGEVGLPILGREAKVDALDAAARAHSVTRADALAIGDGANDLGMITAAGLGIAAHAKPIVAEAADAAISATDLTAALYYQGYSDTEIIWRD